MRTCLAVAFVAAAVALAGCTNDKKTTSTAPSTATVKAVNTTCPVGGKNVDTAVVRTWKGTNVGFCCTNCAGKFDKMTDAEKDAVVTLAKANQVK